MREHGTFTFLDDESTPGSMSSILA
jgi:hypothetical protein